MARYDESWRTQVKSTFAPLPLNAIQLKLDQKQQERDILESQIEGDLNFPYRPLATDDNKAAQIRQEYRQDMDSLRNIMDNQWDLKEAASSIRNIQRKYNLAPNTMLGYSTGGSGGSGGSGNVGPDISAPFIYGAGLSNAVVNYNQGHDAVEWYADLEDPYAPAYHFNNVTMEDLRLREVSGGDPRKQPIGNYKKEAIYDVEGLNDNLTSLAKGWKADGKSWMQNSSMPGYIETYHKRWVHGGENSELYQGLYGFAYNDPGWQRHIDILWNDGTINPNSHNPIGSQEQMYYAQIELDRQAQNAYLDDEGNPIYDNGQEVLNKYIKDFRQQNPNASQQEIDQFRNNILNQAGRDGFAHIMTDNMIQAEVKMASFEDFTMSSKEAWWNKEARDKRMAKYKKDLETPEHVYAGYTVDLEVQPSDINVSDLNQGIEKQRNTVINAKTNRAQQANNMADGIFNVDSDIDLSWEFLSDPSFYIQDVQQNQNEVVGKTQQLQDYDLIDIDSDGRWNINMNNMDIDQWRTITGNDDLEVQDVIAYSTNYNDAIDQYQAQSDLLMEQQLVMNQYATSFVNSDEGKKYIDNKYEEYIDGGGILSKDNFTQGLLQGKDVVGNQAISYGGYPNNIYGGTTYNDFIGAVQNYYSSGDKSVQNEVIVTDWNDAAKKDKAFFNFMSNQQELFSNNAAQMLPMMRDVGGNRVNDVLGIEEEDLDKYNYDVQISPVIMNGRQIFKLSYKATGKDNDINKKDKYKSADVYVAKDKLPEGKGSDLVKAAYFTNMKLINTYLTGNPEPDITQMGQTNRFAALQIGNAKMNGVYSSDGTTDFVKNLYTGGKVGDRTNTVYNIGGVTYFYKKVDPNNVYLFAKNTDGTVKQASYNSVQDGSSAYVDGGLIYADNVSNYTYPNSAVVKSTQIIDE